MDATATMVGDYIPLVSTIIVVGASWEHEQDAKFYELFTFVVETFEQLRLQAPLI